MTVFDRGVLYAGVLEWLGLIFVDGDHVNSVDVIGLDSGELLLGDLAPWRAGWVGIALSSVLEGCDHWLEEIITSVSLSILKFLDRFGHADTGLNIEEGGDLVADFGHGLVL